MASLATCFAILLLLTGCQLSYLSKSAWNHFQIITKQESIQSLIQQENIEDSVKEKLKIALMAREFSIEHMGLKKNKNYTTYVDLQRPYVSWVISASPKWKLEHHHWWFPVVGKLPYKGYFTEKEAQQQKVIMENASYDVFLRGVSAYSTLGWFTDPLLSSMIRYQDYQLVETIIHENMHATLFIKNSADFNERMAVFVGMKGAQEFYLKKEGGDSLTAQLIADHKHDDQLFSSFIGPELDSLRAWYNSLSESSQKDEFRQARLEEISKRFYQQILPQMKTRQYSQFPTSPNNARLLYYKTYFQDLSYFEALWKQTDQQWQEFLNCLKRLEKAHNPEAELISLLNNMTLASHKSCASI